MSIMSVWEARLARENLAPIETSAARADEKLTDKAAGTFITKQRGGHGRAKGSTLLEERDAVDAWKTWAQDVLRTHKFGGKRQRSVWRLYAEGATLTQIERRLRVSRRAITRAIERVERKAPPAPCVNPWRKSGRDKAPRGMNDSQVIALLRSLVENQQEGDTMAAITNKTNVQHYDRIVLLPGKTLDTRWARMHARDRTELVDIDGRPHAGGIDVEMETYSKGERAPTITTFTIPWSMIRQAERSRPDDSEAPANGGKQTEKAQAAE